MPDAAHVLLMVGLEPVQGPLNITDITARLRAVLAGGSSESPREELIHPSLPGMFWEDGTNRHVVFMFLDVPVGRYAAIAHIANVAAARTGSAMGSADIDVTVGLLNLGYVGAVADCPIFSVADPLRPIARSRRRGRVGLRRRLFRGSFRPQARNGCVVFRR